MPEGDTLYRAAAQARVHMLNQVIIECETSLPTIDPTRISGAKLTVCKSIGKHLLMQFGGEVWLHTHLGMNGRWRFAKGQAKVTANRGPKRIVLRTAAATAWCFGAPTMALLTHTQLARHPVLSSLGPDILDLANDIHALVAAFRLHDQNVAIGNALLDQRRCAGIGNVYKSEGLFQLGIHPKQPLSSIDDHQLSALLAQVRKWMFRNVQPQQRGTRWPGKGQHWVYERRGQRCIKCDGQIHRFMLGNPPRVTFVCTSCQPLNTQHDERGALGSKR